MKAEALLALYERVADAPDAIPRLRRLVLDLAVRGKLVEQDEADEPASELIKRLDAAKRAITSRKSSGGATEPRSPDLRLAHAPDHWLWATLGQIGRLSGGMTPSKASPSFWDGEVVWLSPKDIKADELYDSELKITEKGLQETRLELYPPGSLFIVARSGILKRTLPVAINRVPAASNQDLKVLVPHLPGLERFLQLLLRGFEPFILSELVKTGTTVQSLKYEEFEAQAFPLPPLAEQHRIVAKVDELMALLDRLDAARSAREATRDRLTTASLTRLTAPDTDPEALRTHAHFALDALPALTTRADQIKQLRQAILNLAVRGKLVAQSALDEPAELQLRLIEEERAAFGRSNAQSRRDSDADSCDAERAPWPVPSTWTWATVGKLALFTQYGTSAKAYPSEVGVPVLAMGHIQSGRVIVSDQKRISRDSEELPALFLKSGDLLYNRTNSAELVGKTGIYLGDDDQVTFASYLIRIRLSTRYSSSKYVNLAMNCEDFRLSQILPHIKKQTGQANVSGSALRGMLVPVPPLAEQHRIVAKVDELMALCDRLEAALQSADTSRARLLEALLHEALAGEREQAA